MTINLLLNSEGKKMGKTASGAVWLDPNKTSPFEFYQYWRNVDDADVIKCLRMLTFLPLEEIDAMADWKDAKLNEAKDILAKKGVSYKNIWFDSKSEAGKFTSGLYSYPTTYVVDKNGNIVGEPIVGAITAKKQAETLQKLIDQAIANSKG